MTSYRVELQFDFDEEYTSEVNLKPSAELVEDFIGYCNRYLQDPDRPDNDALIASALNFFQHVTLLRCRKVKHDQ